MVQAGLSSQDYWALSPRDLFWLSRQIEEQDRRLHAKFALLCAVVANGLLRKPNKEPFAVEDFMPERPRRSPKDQEELARMARLITGLLGGVVRG